MVSEVEIDKDIKIMMVQKQGEGLRLRMFACLLYGQFHDIFIKITNISFSQSLNLLTCFIHSLVKK